MHSWMLQSVSSALAADIITWPWGPETTPLQATSIVAPVRQGGTRWVLTEGSGAPRDYDVWRASWSGVGAALPGFCPKTLPKHPNRLAASLRLAGPSAPQHQSRMIICSTTWLQSQPITDARSDGPWQRRRAWGTTKLLLSLSLSAFARARSLAHISVVRSTFDDCPAREYHRHRTRTRRLVGFCAPGALGAPAQARQ